MLRLWLKTRVKDDWYDKNLPAKADQYLGGISPGSQDIMKNAVVVIIIYNHRYDKNIEILEKIYKTKFSNIFHLMPFYTGDRPNVISIYENSHFFQGYIAQGFKQYFKESFTHYLFIADDLILNPAINEENCVEYFGLDENTSFIPELITLHEVEGFWLRLKEAYEYSPIKKGVEVANELPTYKEAIARFKKFNLSIRPFNVLRPSIQTVKSRQKMKMFLSSLYSRFKSALKIKPYELSYPLVGGYSDIAIVPSKFIKTFSHLCGVFSATDLFVELALPTAMVLTTEKIVTEKDLKFQGKVLWTNEDFDQLLKFDKDLKVLLTNFPDNCLYIHPIKLSGWDTKI